jgi:selT/selW/selH-like putative selenoprotein
VFDVTVDGALVFSKYSVGRFPEPGEVVAMIRRSAPPTA